MNKKYLLYLSPICFILGVFYLTYQNININSAAIGINKIFIINNYIFGVSLILISILLLLSWKSLERKISAAGLVAVIGLTGAISINANFVPRETTAIIRQVETSKYRDRDIYIIETDRGRFRNEDSYFYGKHNSDELQKKAEKLVGKKAKIKLYGYGFRGIESKEHPARNILNIETK